MSDVQEPSGIPEVRSGSNQLSLSPPPTTSAENSWSNSDVSEYPGEAAQIITGECERLFCDTLSANFLGEGKFARQQSLVVDAYRQRFRPDENSESRIRIQRWLKMWDYSGDAIYRGFVAGVGGDNTLFVFFEGHLSGQGLKSGLMALFELASTAGFDCSRIVACVDRSTNQTELDATIRNLGWVGFELTTLNDWVSWAGRSKLTSDKWLFMAVEVQRSTVKTTEEGKKDSEPSREKYLDGHLSYLRCGRCATDLCLTSQIISKGFTGRHGRAYLVSPTPSTSAVSMTSTSSSSSSLPNTITHRPVPRQLVTGAHTVSDISCFHCGSVLGWKYVAAEEESQRYKVGKYILETKRISATSCWEGTTTTTTGSSADVVSSKPLTEQQLNPGVSEFNNSSPDDVEFDSQDEDECEDLFAGVWSPELASRRRRGRRFERG
ncbi:hypothetical protein FQN54_000993 [Arachnomyces sp. PD_36]|nr:hypothetical protein FQN54_000993 [Arachnomyces sp. PD_36]